MKAYDKFNVLKNQEYEQQFEKVAIYKDNGIYRTTSLDRNNDIHEITFQNTTLTGVYLFECLYLKSYSTAKANAKLTNNGLLEFSFFSTEEEDRANFGDYYDHQRFKYEEEWIKVFPKQEHFVNSQTLSGTGFAIASNGIIATNNHVVDGFQSIKVRGINSDFTKIYNAKLLVSDKNNDLALIQIDDYRFTSAGTIPFTIKQSLAGVGENVFVLGYPLRSTMGDEIKLTNGIVSARTGFQGDITMYQISAPVQPGNSGGPLFDSQGNLIGIINAKHCGAESASYAVKASYLANLIELISNPPKLQTINSLSSKTLVQQVEMVRKFVYIIECE